jgi:hypothetical protein
MALKSWPAPAGDRHPGRASGITPSLSLQIKRTTQASQGEVDRCARPAQFRIDLGPTGLDAQLVAGRGQQATQITRRQPTLEFTVNAVLALDPATTTAQAQIGAGDIDQLHLDTPSAAACDSSRARPRFIAPQRRSSISRCSGGSPRGLWVEVCALSG